MSMYSNIWINMLTGHGNDLGSDCGDHQFTTGDLQNQRLRNDFKSIFMNNIYGDLTVYAQKSW